MVDATTGEVAAKAHLPRGSYAFDLNVSGDGRSGVYANVSDSITGERVWAFIPLDQVAAQTRTDEFTVTVADGHGGSRAVQIVVPVLP
jgi:hypothetical protein